MIYVTSYWQLEADISLLQPDWLISILGPADQLPWPELGSPPRRAVFKKDFSNGGDALSQYLPVHPHCFREVDKFGSRKRVSIAYGISQSIVAAVIRKIDPVADSFRPLTGGLLWKYFAARISLTF